MTQPTTPATAAFVTDGLYPWLAPYYRQITAPFLHQKGHHALLIQTESGMGAAVLCRRLAHWLLCQTPQGAEPCGQCHGCRLFLTDNHPDFHRIAPLENKDIGIDQIRQLTEKMTRHAGQDGNKVVWVDAAERLTEAAANALLKTLEEPRPDTYFILLNESAKPLLATIYSRCQVWHVPPPQDQAVQWLEKQWLEKPWQENPESAEQGGGEQGAAPIIQPNEKTPSILTALAMTGGRPLAALQALTDGLPEKRLAFLRQYWRFYQRRSPLELLPFFAPEKPNALMQLDWIAAFLQDALKCCLDITSHWQTADLASGVIKYAEGQTPQQLLKSQKIIQKVRSDLTEISAVNQELIILDGLTRLITDVFEE